MRLFVAAYPPPEVADDLQQRLAGLAVAPIAARRETWHVTLAFLGEVAAAPSAAVRRAATGPPLTVRLAGGGRFGHGRSTVLWVGVTGAGLSELAARVRREIERTGFPYDRKPFHPHLTVARPGDRVGRAAVDADEQLLAAYRGPDWPVTEIRLMRSHLGSPPAYDTLAAYPLGESA